MKVEILPGCISCGLCESINSDIFTVDDETVHVDNSKVPGNETDCREASEQCPVSVIKLHE